MRDWRLWALLGLFLLVPALFLALPSLDSDQAITGLMGVHVLRGEFPVFFWMQDHAGVPESYAAAVSFFLFGVSRRTLGLAPAVAALGLVLALYRTAVVLFGRGAGLLAILFATVVSPYAASHYVLARAYYIEQLLVGQLVLLGAALWLGGRLSHAARARALVAMGLAGGLGLYFGFQVVTALVPAALACLLVDPALPLRRGAWLGLGAFLLGSLPFWLYNLSHDWATFETGARFQGRASAGEAARVLFANLLVILGVTDHIRNPPYLPGVFAFAAPAVAGSAVALLAARVIRGLRRLRRDPALAGEALLLAVIALTLGAVWWGRYTRVPRYLLPLVPPLVLVLARACQLVWRRSRPLAVALAAVYLGAVGAGLVPDLTILWPSGRAAYRAGRAGDEAVLAFLTGHELRHAYAYEYWYAPRLTFDAGEAVIVAQPMDDRYPPYTAAADRSPRPAYVVAGQVDFLEGWLRALGVSGRRDRVGPYTVYWDFGPPSPVTPLPRDGLRVTTGAGTGEPDSLLDARLDSGWASAPGPPGGAWVEVDLGQPRPIGGLTLVMDQPSHVPRLLEVRADGGAPLVRLDTGGFTAYWRNGGPRTVPSRAFTVRFGPVVARRLRLTDLGPAGTWTVAELFLLTPGAGAGDPAVEDGRRLEAAGAVEPALRRYREAMRAAPDDPAGYAEFTRLGGELGLLSGWPADRAARYARLGLVDEAADLYAGLARGLEPGRVDAELTERRARLAAARGDAGEAAELQRQADAARTPRHPLGVVFGRAVELVGSDVAPPRVRPGDAVEVAYHWRLLAVPPAPLAAYVHFGHAGRKEDRFSDDHYLPERLRGLGDGPQLVMERRRVVVPPDTPPGRYRVVLGVWDPASGARLRRWLAGLLPTPSRTVELATVEVVPR